MKSLSSYLVDSEILEASLLDIEGTLQSSDDYIKFRENIKSELKELQNIKWNDFEHAIGNAFQYIWKCPNFIKYIFEKYNLKEYTDSLLFDVNILVSRTCEECNVDLSVWLYNSKEDYVERIMIDFKPNKTVYSLKNKAEQDIIKSIKDYFKITKLDYIKRQLVLKP